MAVAVVTLNAVAVIITIVWNWCRARANELLLLEALSVLSWALFDDLRVLKLGEFEIKLSSRFGGFFPFDDSGS